MATKPPTQYANVVGIAPVTGGPDTVNWQLLLSLPAFQMYAVEQAGQAPADLMAWMPGWVQAQVSKQALFDDYCQWHAAKGLWENETPLGGLTKWL